MITRTPAVTYDKMSDDVLRQIAEGNGHCYRHEAKSMARELIEFRAERAAGTKTPQQALLPWGGVLCGVLAQR